MWLWWGGCTSGENGENGLGFWLGCGNVPPVKIVKIVKIVKMVKACGWDGGGHGENDENSFGLWLR